MRKISVRWLFLAAVSPALVGLGGLAFVAYQRDRANLQNDMMQTARAMGQAVDTEINGVRKFLQAFAAQEELQAGHIAAARREASTALAASNIADAIVLTDASGQQLFNTLLPAEAAPPRTNNIEHVQQVFTTGEPYVSGLMIGTVAKRPLITVDVPVSRNGRIVYDLNAVLLSSRLTRILQEQGLPADWYCAIFDRSGTIVARSHEPEEHVGKKVSPALLARLAEAMDGPYETQTAAGIPVAAAFARSQSTGYGVAIGVPRTLLLTRIRDDLAVAMAAVAALTLLSLLLVWRLGGALQQRREAQAVAEAERQRLYDILENLPVYVVLLTPDYHVAFANRVFRERFGDDQRRRCYESLFDRSEPCEHCETYSVLGGAAFHEWQWSGPDGRQYAVYDHRFADSGGDTLILEMGIDVTEQRAAARELVRLNRALRLVSECNSALVHATEEAALLDAVCQMVVSTGGYLMAWIGTAENDADKTVRPVAQSGYEEGYLDSIRVSWGDHELGQGPTGTAIRTGLPQVNQNILTNAKMAPWRQAALRRGYQSSIGLPLIAGGATLGALTIYAREAEAFHPDEVSLLEQLANDLAFGMAAMRAETARRLAQVGQWQSEERYRVVLENAPDAILVADPTGRFVYANQQAEHLLEYTAGTLVGVSLADIVPAAEVASVMAQFEELKLLGRKCTEVNFRRRGGSVVAVEVSAVRLPDGNYFGACRDISERRRVKAELDTAPPTIL